GAERPRLVDLVDTGPLRDHHELNDLPGVVLTSERGQVSATEGTGELPAVPLDDVPRQHVELAVRGVAVHLDQMVRDVVHRDGGPLAADPNEEPGDLVRSAYLAAVELEPHVWMEACAGQCLVRAVDGPAISGEGRADLLLIEQLRDSGRGHRSSS